MHKIKFRLLLLLPVFYYAYALVYTFYGIPEAVFPPPASDPFVYDIIADDILEHGVLLPGYPAYFFSPYYAYLFALIKYMTPDPVLMFKIIISFQAVLFLGSVYIFYRLADLGFSNAKGAVISALLYAFYPVCLFYTLLPLKDGTALPLTVFALYLIISGVDSKSFVRLAGAAFLVGVLVTLRGTFLPAALIAGAYIYMKTDFRLALCFTAVVFLPAAPLTVRNITAAEDFVLTRAVSGIHAYIGANENADVQYIKTDGIRADTFGHFYDAKKLAEKRTGHEMKASEVNRYWKAEAVKYILTNPGDYLEMTGTRLLYMLNSREMPNNYSFEYFKAEYAPYKIYGYLPYSFGVVFLLGCAGFIYVPFSHKRFILLLLAVFVFMSALTFAAGRYRLVSALFLMLGQSAFICAAAEKRFKVKAFTAGVFLALALVTFYPLGRFSEKEEMISREKSRMSMNASNFYKTRGSEAFRLKYMENKQIWAASYRKHSPR